MTRAVRVIDQEPKVRGMFRFTNWGAQEGEHLEILNNWARHFAQLGIRTKLIRDGEKCALFREGVDAAADEEPENE